LTHVTSKINVKPRKTSKLNAIELIMDKSTLDVCRRTCINDVMIILVAIEKPNDETSI